MALISRASRGMIPSSSFGQFACSYKPKLSLTPNLAPTWRLRKDLKHRRGTLMLTFRHSMVTTDGHDNCKRPLSFVQNAFPWPNSTSIQAMQPQPHSCHLNPEPKYCGLGSPHLFPADLSVLLLQTPFYLEVRNTQLAFQGSHFKAILNGSPCLALIDSENPVFKAKVQALKGPVSVEKCGVPFAGPSIVPSEPHADHREQKGSVNREVNLNSSLRFSNARQSAHSLLLWLQQQPGLRTVDIRAQLLIGSGNSSQSTHMTQKDQQEVIQKLRDGTLNLLVATSVAEEGLDTPQCNVVVRYGLLNNEISMVQARGRARAGQSVYSFVATKGSRELQRELINEALETLMEQAVAAVQKMDRAEYQAKIQDLQQAAMTKRVAQAAQRESQRLQFPMEHVQLLCINCMVAVGHGSDLWKVEGAHHVNVNPNFSIYYNVSREPVVINKVFKDWKPGGVTSCRNCGEVWGLQIIYKSVKLPVLKAAL
nr:probable ATP-dependent RNA helicase DHX58 [Saimiri boliviensis boliviensis]